MLHFAMHDTPITVVEHTTEDGRNPFREWLAELRDREAAARVRVRLARIRLGNLGDCRAVGKGVSELRVSYGPGYRVYFGRKGEAVVVLLCGGDKRTQEDDIELAQVYWADYLWRAR
jgi:putative addiction module killer protein